MKECQQCGSTEKIEEHHIIWTSKGGEDTQENKIYLCYDCHKRLHGKKRNSKPRLVIEVEDIFIKQAKSRAYAEGKTLKEKIIELLTDWLKKK